MITVCSGFSPDGYESYGKRFLETFDQYWPRDEFWLTLYVEQSVPRPPRCDLVGIYDCEGLGDFIARHSGTPAHRGRATERYNFRFDAVKFCRQLFFPEHRAKDLPDGEILVWLDADVVTFGDIPASLIEELLGDAHLCYLGRGQVHSEIGFWACRLNPTVREFLHNLAELYRSDQVFKLREWHSAFVFDHCRVIAQAFGMNARDLTPGGRGHVWMTSRLANFMDHLKGDKRKALGKSWELPA
jgi:hypothetical protein